MSQNITIQGATYSAVPSVLLPKQGGGTASFVDITDTTAAAEDVASGKYFYTAAGVRTEGTSSGGNSTTKVDSMSGIPYSYSVIVYHDLIDEPTSFSIIATVDEVTSSNNIILTAVYDGTNCMAQTISDTANSQISYSSNAFSYTYDSEDHDLTVTFNSAVFRDPADTYKLVYTYDGSSSNIHTKDVQVGSGATSITFTGLEDEPLYWSCIFKSNFSTSSGYQRVISTGYDGIGVYGLSMDSQAYAYDQYDNYWSYSYNNGSLTITSQGTNAGGYFHQPGYYQLTYAVDSSAPQYETISKTYRASTSAQSETITASGGYDAIEEVSVSIPAVSQTNLTAGNIKSGTTVTISNGQNNLWSVTGTYSGGGGTSKNVQLVQNSSTRITATSYTKACGDITVSKTGTYDVYWTAYRTSSSGTWGTQLYIGSSSYGSAQTSFSNSYFQTVHLTNVSLTQNRTVSVYGRSRGNNYYLYVGQLVIIES